MNHTPSPDTRQVYVATDGNDAAEGTQASPVRSLAAGYALLRDGYPDHLLLRAGDAWDEPLPFWAKSGRSATEPMVVGVYGEGRAKVQKFESICPVGATRAHLVIADLHMADYPGTGISILNAWKDVRIQNVLIERCGSGISFGQCDPGQRASDILIDGCVVVDSYTTGTNHPQGMIFGEVDGLTITGCVLDHNGWYEPAGAVPTIFRHNLYIQHDCTGVWVHNNVVSRAASTGISQRCGGSCYGNLCLQNPIPIGFGHASSEAGVWGDVTDNVVIDSRDIDAANPRAYGIVCSQANGVTVRGNFVAYQRSGTDNGFGLGFDFNFGNVSIADNIVWGWNAPDGTPFPALKFTGTQTGPISARGNTFQPDGFDPHRTIEDYMAHLGRSGGIAEFMELARTQHPDFTAPKVNAWVREGFRSRDIDGDGRITVNDYIAFQNLYAAGSLRADLDGDGRLTINDYMVMMQGEK